MADNNDLNDIDIDIQDDIAGEQNESQPSLKEAWSSNPLMKIAAVVLGGAVLFGGYTAFSGSGATTVEGTVIGGVGATKDVKIVPGQETSDVEYTDAMKQQNKNLEEQAKKNNESFMPIPIATPEQEGIALPEQNNPQAKTDPLEEWRQKMEAIRVDREKKAVEQEPEPLPQPEVVPVVQPIQPRPTIPGATNNKQDEKAMKALAGQMRVIVGAQSPKESRKVAITNVASAYNQMKQEEAQLEEMMKTQGVDSAGYDEGDSEYKTKMIVPAGSIIYAQLMNDLNSDFAGPALAQILSGPFAGGRAMGSFQVKNDYLTLSFSRIVKDGVTYGIDGVALDETSTLAAHRTDIDRHYFSRVILPAAARFLEGYSAAVAETGTETTTTAGGGVATSNPEPDAQEELYAGLKESSAQIADFMREDAGIPVTVKVARGTTMGILLMDSVTTSSVRN